MAKKRKNKKKIENVKRRNAVAVKASLRTGAGKHQDRRTRRKRTRAAKRRAALAEYR